MENSLNHLLRQYNDNQRRYHENVQQMLHMINRQQENRRFPARTRNRENLIYNFIRNYAEQRESEDLEDVVVRPTPLQIEEAVVTTIYETTMPQTQCPITLEQFEEGDEICRIRHCSHTFKKNAIMDWFSRNVRCPVCRYDIRDQPVQSSRGESSPFLGNLQNTLQTIFSNNLQNIPFTMENDADSNILYTFDIPLAFDLSGMSFDLSGNYRL